MFFTFQFPAHYFYPCVRRKKLCWLLTKRMNHWITLEFLTVLPVKDSLIPSLIDQSQFWPQNFKPQNIIPSLTSLALKLKNDATKTILTAAKIADSYAWCHDLLESILQELESLVLEAHNCQLLKDLIKDDSTELLWQSCVSSNLIEQQTAIRLLLLACECEKPYSACPPLFQ